MSHLNSISLTNWSLKLSAKFLSLPITFSLNTESHKANLLSKLKACLAKVDKPLDTKKQKTKLYSPRLTWDPAVHKCHLSWIERNQDTITTRYPKKWSGLPRSTQSARLFLPKVVVAWSLQYFHSVSGTPALMPLSADDIVLDLSHLSRYSRKIR